MNDLETLEPINIEDMIYEIRGVQVMLDSDLAKLYQCKNGTKDINRAVKNNPNKFPKRFSWVLTTSEKVDLRLKFSSANVSNKSRVNPRVFTEQGIYMLATILKTPVAVDISIKIMDTFTIMRKLISNNLIEQNHINNMVIDNNERLNLVENTLNKLNEKQKINSIFYEGQIFDAYVAFKEICDKAKEEIIIIDNYAGKELLKLIKDIKVNIIIITKNINEEDYKKYEKQYSNVEIKYSNKFHDRFIIIDKKEIYHCGCSFKDLGEKCFAITKMEEKCVINELLKKL